MIIGTPCLTVLMQQINTYHCSSAIVEVSLRISELFFLFSAFYMEIRISQFHFDLFSKILNSCQSSLFGSEFLICFLEFLIGIRISKKITFLSEFLVGIRNSMLSFLWGSEFLKVSWTSLWGSEFLKVFWTSLWE